ncbi:MAG: FG-GAP repeat domain-containing protein [Planctomycetota bacterium]
MTPQKLGDLAFREVSPGLPVSGTWRGYPLLFDFTGDGRADLVASNREEDGFSAWTFDAEQGWQLRNEGLPRGMSYGPSAAADFDGDKIPDLALIDHQRSLRLFKNDGNMRWSELPAPGGRKPLAMDIAAGDIDGDGRADIVGIAHFNGGMQVYLNQGDGRLELHPAAASMLGDKGFGRAVELEDLDLDGTLDIVAATENGVKAYLTRTKPSLSFEDVSAGFPRPFGGNTIYAVAVGRFSTNSKRPQIAVALVPDPGLALDQRNSLAVYAWDEAKNSWSTIDKGLVRTEFCLDVHAADFDADGALDLLAVSFQSGVVLYRGDGSGQFEPAGRLPCKSLGRLAIGDIDGDRRPDVAMACPSPRSQVEPGGIRVFANQPAAW